MKKISKLWMLVAILTSATMFSSCIDNEDNPATPVSEPVETPKQAQFWSKFDKWQTDSCTVGDDFYMHILHNFWWNPKDIYPDGMMDYAQSLLRSRVTAMESDNTDADLKILSDVCEKASAEIYLSEEELADIMIEAIPPHLVSMYREMELI